MKTLILAIALVLSIPAFAEDATGPLAISSGTNVTLTGTAGLTGVIAANDSRRQAIVINTGTNAAYILLTATNATTSNYDLIANPATAGIVYPVVIGPGYTGAFSITTGTTGNSSVHVSQLLR